MTTHFEAIIDETAADRPGLDARRFNQLCLKAPSLEGLIDALKERYGVKSLRISPTNGVYIDTKDGETRRIGFTRSFWNRDDGHGKAWWQCDWITFRKVTVEEVVF